MKNMELLDGIIRKEKKSERFNNLPKVMQLEEWGWDLNPDLCPWLSHGKLNGCKVMTSSIPSSVGSPYSSFPFYFHFRSLSTFRLC